jgi:hypothetical protein
MGQTISESPIVTISALPCYQTDSELKSAGLMKGLCWKSLRLGKEWPWRSLSARHWKKLRRAGGLPNLQKEMFIWPFLSNDGDILYHRL